jgi:hypothetical protein
MKRSEYLIELSKAIEKAGLSGFVVPGGRMTSVAMHLPTNVLRAVINKEVFFEDDSDSQYLPKSGAIAFHVGWTEACDDELTDRILTENLDEGKEQE